MPSPVRRRPATFFKYQPVSPRTLENLKQRMLWISAPAKFNDPFDCAASMINSDLSEKQIEQIFEYLYTKTGPRQWADTYRDRDSGRLIERFRDEVRRGLMGSFDEQVRVVIEQRGVACFAETATDLLMWGHYADGHRGFCLGFDATVHPFSTARQVVYRAELPRVDAVRLLLRDRDDEYDQQVAEAMLLTKAACWNYEREWRVLLKEANCPLIYRDCTLTSVHLGAQMPDADRKSIATILTDSPTSMFQVTRSAKSFSVQIRQIDGAGRLDNNLA